MKQIINNANTALNFNYKARGLQDLLLSPPNDNIMNIADTCLAYGFYQTWLKGFFSFAGLKSFERQVAMAEVLPFSVLARNSTDLHMTWTYDPGVDFKRQQRGESQANL